MKVMRITLLVLFVLLGCSIWFGIHQYNKNQNSPEVNDNVQIAAIVEKQVKTEAKIVAKEVDEKGLQHTVARMTAELKRGDLDRAKADLLDTVAALNIARERLKQVTVVSTSLAIQNQKLIKTLDEQSNSVYSFRDDYASGSVTIPRDSSRQATLDLAYNLDLINTQYRKYSFPRGYDNYIDLYANDKRVTIQGVKTLTIEQKPPFFAGRVQASSLYDLGSKDLLIGPAASVDLGRMNLEGKYLVKPSGKDGRWMVGVNYNLVKF